MMPRLSFDKIIQLVGTMIFCVAMVYAMLLVMPCARVTQRSGSRSACWLPAAASPQSPTLGS